MKPKYLFGSDPWMLAEDIPEMDFNFSDVWITAFANDMEKTVGMNYKKILCVYKGLNLKFYYGEKDSNNFANHVLGRIIKNPEFGKKINSRIRYYSDKLKLFSRGIEPQVLQRLDNLKFKKFLKQMDALHTTLYTWGWLPNAVDMFHANFTNYLKSILRKRLSEDEINSALVTLTTTAEKSVLQQEHESFLKLVALKQKSLSAKKFDIALEKHYQKYFYLKHLWLGLGGVYNRKYYLTEISKFIKSGDNALNMLKKENQILRETLAQRAELIKKLKLTKSQINLFKVYAEFAITKLYRRDAQIYWSYKMDCVFAEYHRRFRIPLLHTRFLFPHEVIESLDGGMTQKLKSELNKRVKLCIRYVEKGYGEFWYGKKAENFMRALDRTPTYEIKELEGQPACLGKVRGSVRIINIISDMRKMKQGDILVNVATNPDIVPAMKKAGAIVTEQGGITSHAAIVSRELGIPCVIGTKIATKAFKDGDLVEVDANRGIVRLLKKHNK